MADGLYLIGYRYSVYTRILFDCLHLAPMMAYFVMAPQGAKMLGSYPALQRWWQGIADRPSLVQTDPFTGC